MRLEIQHISKQFTGIPVLRDVSWSVASGEIHALCGENGAGKSTLMNIITGNLFADAGGILWKGRDVHWTGPQQSIRAGISMVYQDLQLVTDITVAENIFLHRLPTTRFGSIDWNRLFSDCRRWLEQLGLHRIDVRSKVGDLHASSCQLVQIARALVQKPELLILDEPTALLTEEESILLSDILRRQREQGTSVIYITHRMREVERLCDRVSVLKDGTYQGTWSVSETSMDQVIQSMIGRNLETTQRRTLQEGKVLLKVRKLGTSTLSGCSFDLKQGEILGIGGLMQSGRTTLARTFIGEEKILEGTIDLDGMHYKPTNTHDALNRGIIYLPEERKSQSIFPDLSIQDNLAVSMLEFTGSHKMTVAPVKAAGQLFPAYGEKLGIRYRDPSQPIRELSGGNQQKVILARCLAAKPRLLIADEPTQGVDVRTKQEIYAQLFALASQGVSILLISSELPELLLMSDRILVLHEGRVSGLVSGREATEESIIRLASGLTT